MNKERIIGLENIRKVYSNGIIQVEALRDVNLKINRGEMISIMGPSGSGKSTLMNILGCLDTPTEGRYFLDDLEVTAVKDKKLTEVRNRKSGLSFSLLIYCLSLPPYKMSNCQWFMQESHQEREKRVSGLWSG